MGLFGGGSQSAGGTGFIPPPPVPSATPSAPSFGRSLINKSSNRGYGGYGSTILTSGQGDLTPTNTAKKSLLGQ